MLKLTKENRASYSVNFFNMGVRTSDQHKQVSEKFKEDLNKFGSVWVAGEVVPDPASGDTYLEIQGWIICH